MRVDLVLGSPGMSWALLRPLTGRDEYGLDPQMPAVASRLLDSLLVATAGTAAAPGCVPALTVADRDRLLAGLYRALFGSDVTLVAACEACGEKLEVSFSIDALLANQTPQPSAEIEGPDRDGFYRLRSGIVFRPPVVADLDAVAHLPADAAVTALLMRCVRQADEEIDVDAVQRAMDAVAPVLDLDIATTCPHCQTPQNVPFSLEAQLIGLLEQERGYLTREIHRLARAYGWSLRDILDLGRDDRRTLVRHVEAEREGRATW